MSNLGVALGTAAVLTAAVLTTPQAHATITIGPPVFVESQDKVTFQLAVAVVGEAFPEVLALEVDVSFDAPPLSAIDVQIHPDSPYSVGNAGLTAPLKQPVIHLPLPPGTPPGAQVDRHTFLFLISGPIEAGPLLRLSLDFAKDGPQQTQLGTLVRFQGFDETALEPEYNEPRFDSIPLAIPEPGAGLLMLAGLGLLAAFKLRQRAG